VRLHTPQNWRAAITVCLAILRFECPAADNLSLSTPIFGIRPGAAQLSLTNSSDTNFQYVVQTSSNLQDWVSVTTNFATGPDSPVTVPAPPVECFYRLMVIPHVPTAIFRYAIMATSRFNANGNDVSVDSFDSSSVLYSTLGQYDVLLRKAGGDIATDSSIDGAVSVGNSTIYGRVYTGFGTSQSSVQLAPEGAIGSISWNVSEAGIQPGYWSGSFYINFPDVTGPASGSNSLPPAASRVVTLNGGTYVVPPSDPGLSATLLVTAPTTLWVQGSYTAAGITITGTNNGSLMLYVGMASGSSDSFSFATNEVNQPGYANALQIYGLPSLTSVVMNNNDGFVGTIYAPEADATFGNSGGFVSDVSGAIVAKSLTLNGHFNFHFDEYLKVRGPMF
jgi:hypothetical protein